jgi:serine/threonine protein kinase
MAPEQTGRMNRPIDSRSDLYSLGVSFYEMLTGVLPFKASDPTEWVHCHIDRRPVAPDQYAKEIPAPLSAIVMKLLAKTAEERYQITAGVAGDLRHCLKEWEAHCHIDPFQLGAHDISDRLLIPERLMTTLILVRNFVASHEVAKAGGWNIADCAERSYGYCAGTREILEDFLEGRPYRKEYLIAYKGRLAGAGAYAYKTRQ